jgi:DNA-binding beta-propeller fold protein YncE
MPLDMAVTKDGATLYVAAFGSSKVGVFSTSALEDDSFDPVAASANYIPVSGGGVSGRFQKRHHHNG